MFTGIIQELGTIQKIENVHATNPEADETKTALIRLTIKAPNILSQKKKIGDSVAVDGACLTITSLTGETFTADAIPETLNKTIIVTYTEGTQVNLEEPLKIGDTLDGHMVQGHVDFVGKITNIKTDCDSTILRISFPEDYAKYFALKGSVTINGVSLTISLLLESSLEVSLIHETMSKTNLGSLKINSPVNVEIDLIARYLDSLLQDKAQQTNYWFLRERGFI